MPGFGPNGKIALARNGPMQSQGAATPMSSRVQLANKEMSIDDCMLPMNRGTGSGSMVRMFYYDSIERRCKPMSWTRMGGNKNRFNTFQLCRDLCGEKMAKYFLIADIDSGTSDEDVIIKENE